MTNIEALEVKELNKNGVDRYFVWLCKMQEKLEPKLRLNDPELYQIAYSYTDIMGKING